MRSNSLEEQLKTKEQTMETENEKIARLESESQELKMDLSDNAQALKEARAEEARLKELVEVYGQRQYREELTAARVQIGARLREEERLNKAVLGKSQELGTIARRQILSARLARENQLTEAQEAQLKTALEEGQSESQVGELAARLGRKNTLAGLGGAENIYTPAREGEVEWQFER